MISTERFKDFKAEHVLNGLQLSFLETMMMFNKNGVKKLRYMTKKEFSDAYYGMTTLPFSLEVSEATAKKAMMTNKVALRDKEGLLVGTVDVRDIWKQNTEIPICRNSWMVGGSINVIKLPDHFDFRNYRSTDFKAPKPSLAFVPRFPLLGNVSRGLSRVCSTSPHIILPIGPDKTKAGFDPSTTARTYIEGCRGERFLRRSRCTAVPLPNLHLGARERVFEALFAKKVFGSSHILLRKAAPETSSVCSILRDAKLGIEPVLWDVRNLDRSLASVRSGAERLPPCAPEVARLLSKRYPPRSRQGFCVFFTGLSGSGKSTAAKNLSEVLASDDPAGRRVTVLDGDVVRKNLSKGLGFSKQDRDTNILRIGYVASLVVKSGGIAICAPIAPYKEVRRMVRRMCEDVGGFVEVHMSTPVGECERRDIKGLYAKARRGVIKNFTGVNDPYEIPEHPEVRVDTTGITPEESVTHVINYLKRKGYF